MKEEETKGTCVAKMDMKIMVMKGEMLMLIGVISDVNAQDINNALKLFEETHPYHIRIRRVKGGTTILLEDALGSTVHIDTVTERMAMMHTTMQIVGESLILLNRMKNLCDDYEGSKKALEAKESGDETGNEEQ